MYMYMYMYMYMCTHERSGGYMYIQQNGFNFKPRGCHACTGNCAVYMHMYMIEYNSKVYVYFEIM